MGEKQPTARRPKVCLVPMSLMHGACGSGAAVRMHDLAGVLAAAGYHVDILDVGAGARLPEENARLRRIYRDEGMRLVVPPQPSAAAARSPHGRLAEAPYIAYEYLKGCDYDIVHASDDHGLAYYYLQAKRLGLLERPAAVWVHSMSPFLYRLEIGETMIRTYSDPMRCYLERRCVEWADVAVVQSAGLRDWMVRAGYEIDPEAVRIDPGLSSKVPAGLAPRADANARRITRLLYVGRLNPVKGLTTFCYAVRELVRRNCRPAAVAFLGASDPDFDADTFIKKQAAEWDIPWELHAGMARRDAQAELARPGTLPVFAAGSELSPLAAGECIALGVPFVATDVGDLGQMLDERDRAAALVEPHHLALAERLQAVLTDGAAPLCSRLEPEGNAETWVAWHEGGAGSAPDAHPAASMAPRRETQQGADPVVSVCIAHYNRPNILRHTLDSLAAQTFRGFEIIVVDDGSEPEKCETLKKILQGYEQVHLVVQENRYLGAARNAGARRARGRYLLFMDDDNCARPEELATLVGIAERRPCDILVSFSDNFTGTGPATPDSLNGIRRLPFGQDLVYGLFRNGYGDSNCFMRREVWEALGGFTEHYRVGLDDHEFFTRATLAGYSIDVVPEALYYYRLAESKMKRFHASRRADFARILQPYLDAGVLASDLVPLLFAARGFHEQLLDSR